MKVALFPIPGSVHFPFTKAQLHVFEPRYRKMVSDCVQESMYMAVSHTKKMVSEKTVENFNLNQNLSTFEPQNIFCAGPIQVLQEFPDGRFLIEIIMKKRLVFKDEVQSLPYKIVECDEFSDEKEILFSQSEKRDAQKSFVIKFLKDYSQGQTEFIKILNQQLQDEMSLNTFTFKVFNFLRLNEEQMQFILELNSAEARLEIILDLIKKAAPRSFQ